MFINIARAEATGNRTHDEEIASRKLQISIFSRTKPRMKKTVHHIFSLLFFSRRINPLAGCTTIFHSVNWFQARKIESSVLDRSSLLCTRNTREKEAGRNDFNLYTAEQLGRVGIFWKKESHDWRSPIWPKFSMAHRRCVWLCIMHQSVGKYRTKFVVTAVELESKIFRTVLAVWHSLSLVVRIENFLPRRQFIVQFSHFWQVCFLSFKIRPTRMYCLFKFGKIIFGR